MFTTIFVFVCELTGFITALKAIMETRTAQGPMPVDESWKSEFALD